MSRMEAAATVVLLRDGAEGAEVLLLERPRDSGSFAGAWVFPGGKVDPQDYDGGEAETGRLAARRAGARETREETGLVLDAADLVELSCWIPPAEAPRRFHTWFFLGAAPEGMPGSRRALLWAARQFSGLVLGIPRRVTDPQSGARALSAKAARAIDFRQDRMAHCSEILRKSIARAIDFRQDRMAHCSEILRLAWRDPSLRCVEVPVKVRYTADTLAKGQKAGDALKIVWQLLLGAFR